jgi:clostripain
MLRQLSTMLCVAMAHTVVMGPSIAVASEPDWTVMIYGGTDSSAEEHILDPLRKLQAASAEGQNGEFILLYDRSPGFTNDAKMFGEDFEDTRLFRLSGGKWDRIAGGSEFSEITVSSECESNTGDAHTLKKFIRSCKMNYPAKRYALILLGHGENFGILPDMSSICADTGNKPDFIFTAEFTEVLSDEESVDFIWFDVCSFGGIENAYQLRPGNGRFSAKAMIATPPVSNTGPMGDILVHAGLVGKTSNHGQVVQSGLEFGTAATQTMRQLYGPIYKNQPDYHGECWGLYDLSFADDVKNAMDNLARAMKATTARDRVEAIRGSGSTPLCMNYMREPEDMGWVLEAHFDLYDLASRIRDATDLDESVRTAASTLAETVDKFMADSFGGPKYANFQDGKNGIYVIFPDGDARIARTTHWATFEWFHPNDRRTLSRAFGNYAWCSDGATEGNDKVENWFELLDAWFDETNDTGGLNKYRW